MKVASNLEKHARHRLLHYQRYCYSSWHASTGVGRTRKSFERMTIKLILKVCSVAGLVLFLVVGLASPNFQPRSGFGWEIDHFVGYFVLTLIFCRAWPRRLGVAGGLIAFALLLEGLQALPPDRSSNLLAAFYSAGGVLTATLFAELFIRARRRSQPKYTGGSTRGW